MQKFQVEITEKTEESRSKWGNPIEFILSCLGYAIGLGNVWRFPYLCYRNGGGAFVFAYLVMLVLMGMPIFLLELLLGQYSGVGPDQVFTNLAPIFAGLGYCTVVVIYLVTVYYMVIIAWVFFYLFTSFKSDLDFGSCTNSFNSIGCYSATEEANCNQSEIYYNKTCVLADEICKKSDFVRAINKFYCIDSNGNKENINNIIKRTAATEEYFRERVLNLGDATWEHFGTMNWPLVGCLLFAWFITFFCVLRGVKTSGKVAYFTALFPYVLLTVLVVKGVLLEGAMDGLEVYLNPKWEALGTVEVWANAASQTFYSFGIACGSLITLSSYSDFKNNCLKDAFIVTAANAFTSIYAGIAIFSMLGFLANQMHLPVDVVAKDGPGLAFVAYPEAILRLPMPTVWAILFFFMLIILGMGSQFAGVEAISCLILDRKPQWRKYQPYIMLAIALSCFLLALPMCFQGGIYIFTLMEWNTASWAILLIGLAEIVIISWMYGCDRLFNNMEEMNMNLRTWTRYFWKFCWVFITPATLLGVFIFQMVNFQDTYYEDYTFPTWANVLGIMIGLATLAPMVICALYQIFFSQKYTWRELWTPTSQWGPQKGKTESNITLTKGNISTDELAFHNTYQNKY